MSTEVVAASTDILSSWKEIALYLNRGVRTVQRWETDLGMPVRRPRGSGRSAVIAVRSEIDVWIKCCPTEATHWSLAHLESLRASTMELHRLRGDLHLAGSQLSAAVGNLKATLEKLVATSSATSTNFSHAYACAAGGSAA